MWFVNLLNVLLLLLYIGLGIATREEAIDHEITKQPRDGCIDYTEVDIDSYGAQ